MTRILITGMSGTGKTSVAAELGRRGRPTVDLDCAAWSHWIETDDADDLTPAEGRDWVWRIDRVRHLLAHAHGDLFVSGCAENMEEALDLVDVVVLLSAPTPVILQRLEARSDGYGRSVEERAKVMALIATVEPQLRAAADIEVTTIGPVEAVVDELLRRLS